MCRHFPFLPAFLFCVFIAAHTEDLKRDLDRNLHDKFFLLRNFYRGDVVRYDAQGEPIGSPQPGSWTVDGVVAISKVTTKKSRVEFHARRYFLIGGHDGYELSPANREVLIEGDFSQEALTRDSVGRFISRVFLNQTDTPADTVPPFWKPCFGELDASKPCRLSPKIAPLFRFATPPSAPQLQKAMVKSGNVIEKGGPGVSAPHATYDPDPEYSEEARRNRVQAIVILELVVDTSGRPRDLKVVSPAGYGLDEKAMNVVKTWKFEPARRGGDPVSVMIDVEVAFRLYN